MFDEIKIEINNSDEKRNSFDYSRVQLQNGALLGAFCTEIKQCQIKQWRKTSDGKAYLLKDDEGKPIMAPGIGFVCEVIDDNGLAVPLLYGTTGKITYGSRLKSGTYKAIKALKPTTTDEILRGPKEEVESRIRKLLNDLAEEVKNQPIGVLIEIAVKIIPPKPPQYPNEFRRFDITDIKPEPSRRVTPTPEEKAQDPASSSNKIGIKDFDDDDIPM